MKKRVPFFLQLSVVFLSIFIGSFSVLQAQNNTKTLSGTITDKATGEAIPGVNVFVQDTYYGVISNSNGYYELTGLDGNSEYTIVFKLIGYEPQSHFVKASYLEKWDIELSPSNQLLDEVLVQGTRASNNTATSYSEMNQEDIAKLNTGQDVPFMLRQLPSVVVTSDAGAGVGYTGMRIRGTDATRVNITINGIPYNDPESHGTFWVNMPDFSSSIDNVQVQRGVGTSTNGAGAFGGSVNIQTTTLNKDAYTEYSGAYGSFNTWKNTVSFGSGLLNNRFTLDGRLSKITSDGYIDRASSDLKSFFISGAYYGKNSILRANVFSGKEVTYQSWYGLPEYLLEEDRTYNYYTYDNEVDNYQQDHYQLHYSKQFNKQWNASAALHYTYGRGYFEQFKDGEDLADYGFENTSHFNQTITEVLDSNDMVIDMDTSFVLATNTDLIRRRWLDNHFYGFTYGLNYHNHKFNATLGGAWNNYMGDHFGEVIWAGFMGDGAIRQRYYDNTGTKMDFNVYLKAGYQLTKQLYAFADLQVRTIDYHVEGIDNDRGAVDFGGDYQFFNPKMGLNYQLAPNKSLYASFSIANREPNRSNFLDNAEIPRSEQLRDFELGYKYNSARYALQANFYYMNYKDQLVLTGEVNDVGSSIQQNVDMSYRTGFEIAGGMKLFDQLEWQANATFSINKISEFSQYMLIFDGYDYNYLGDTTYVYKDSDIAFSPNLIAASTLTYTPVKGLDISLLSKYVGRQFLDNTNDEDRQLDAYFTNDIRLGYGFSPGFADKVEFSFMVNNVFNSLYESNGGTYVEVFDSGDGAGPQQVNYDWYYPQAGTHFMGGLSIRF